MRYFGVGTAGSGSIVVRLVYTSVEEERLAVFVHRRLPCVARAARVAVRMYLNTLSFLSRTEGLFEDIRDGANAAEQCSHAVVV